MKQAGGFSLIEVLIATALVALLAGAALPNYRDLLARQALRAGAQALSQDLGLARLHSQQSGHPVYWSQHSGEQWCWGASQRPACDCRRQSCELLQTQAAEHPGLSLLPNSSRAPRFDARTGLPDTPQHWTLGNAQGQQLQVRLSPLGRAQLCTPGGEQKC